MAPAEILLPLLLGALSGTTGLAAQQDEEPIDAALLEFLAEWSGTDSEWLDNELLTERVDVTAVPV